MSFSADDPIVNISQLLNENHLVIVDPKVDRQSTTLYNEVPSNPFEYRKIQGKMAALRVRQARLKDEILR